MPQRQLPIFPEGVTEITNELAVKKEAGRVIYFNGHMPVFIHAEDDIASFRMITSQFCVNGSATQADIIRAFGVTSISVKRGVKRYREQGPKGFFEPRKTRKATVLTTPTLAKAQALFDEGCSVAEVAKTFDIKPDTIKKAIHQGRLKKPPKSADEKKRVLAPKAAKTIQPRKSR